MICTFSLRGPSTAAASTHGNQRYWQDLNSGIEHSASRADHFQQSSLADLRLCVERHNAACATAALARIREPKLQKTSDYIALRAHAQALEREEKHALAANQSAIKANPKQAQYLITRGHIYEKFGDQLDAIQSYLEAAKLEPDSPEPLYFIGASFFLLAEQFNSPQYFGRAERNLKAALKLSPDCDRAEFMLGAIAAVEGRLAEARVYLAQATRMKNGNPYYHLHYGILLKRLGDDTVAMKEMETAERLNPSYALAHYELGSLYERLGNYTEARTQLESAVEVDPHLSAAYYHLRNVYRQLGLLHQSKKAYDEFKLTQAHERQDLTDPAAAAISPDDGQNIQHHE